MEDYLGTLISGVIALLFIGLGFPLANRKIPPNRWYGYRVSRYQFEDDDIWYAVNQKGGLHFVFAGVGCLLLAATSALFIGKPGAQAVFMLVLTVMLFVFIIYEISWSVRLAKRMAREKGLLSEQRHDDS
jgi:hypothetical protein